MDYAYLKGLVGRLLTQTEAILEERTMDIPSAERAIEIRERLRARQQRLTLVQRVALVLLFPAILATFLAPAGLIAPVWLAWVWLVGALTLAVEVLRRQIVGVEPKQYIGMTLVWLGAALAFTVFYVF